jgi:hypothetical protein
MTYGTGLVAFCLLLGRVVGYGGGRLLETSTDLGGVGIAMLALLVVTESPP